MAKNKTQKTPSQQDSRSSAPGIPKGSSESVSGHSSSAPSPMDMAHKRKEKRFGHN